jgi:hypothetical protein
LAWSPALVAGLVVWSVRGSGEAVAPNYLVAADAGLVIAGQATAPVTVDVYTDYMCPGCERFENAYRDELTEALNAGQVVLRHHPIAILDDRSIPPGYSTRAANAVLCAVPAGIFPSFHDTLFTEQPAQDSAGLTDDQLIGIGTRSARPATSPAASARAPTRRRSRPRPGPPSPTRRCGGTARSAPRPSPSTAAWST